MDAFEDGVKFMLITSRFLNDTWIFNSSSNTCSAFGNNTSSAQCKSLRGGFFDVASSTTARNFTNATSAGAALGDTLILDDTRHDWVNPWVTDNITLGDAMLAEYPLGMAGENGVYATQASIGVSSNSTLLNALKAAGHIASRSYGWFWGLNSANPSMQMDGSIVFGGYDTAKIDDINNSITGSIAQSTEKCRGGMAVTIFDVYLDFPNGTSYSMLDSLTLSACIELDWPVVMSLPSSPVFDGDNPSSFTAMSKTQWIDRESSPGISFWGLLYPADDVYQGALTVNVNNQLNVTIPNDILVVPPQYVDSNGTIQTNNSVRELLLNGNAASTAQDTLFLGRQFFSAAYLMVDLDNEQFTMWKANPTTSSELVSVGNSSTCTTPKPSPPTASTNFGPIHDGLKQYMVTQKLATIVPAVVGSLFVAAAVFAILVFLFQKRRLRKLSKQKKNAMLAPLTDPSSHHPGPGDPHGGYHREQYTPVHEMSDAQLYEAAAARFEARELPSEAKPAEMHVRNTSDWRYVYRPKRGVAPAELGSP